MSDILSRLNLRLARLVNLSACETGWVDFRQATDEHVGLPAGFLQAGAVGVISSLWAVNDLSTMLLMERFYQHHLEGTLPAVALRQAQLWLRQVTAGELVGYFAEKRRKRTGYEQASAAWRRFARLAPDERPFAHPFYWAAFTFTSV